MEKRYLYLYLLLYLFTNKERFMCNEMFTFLTDNSLISPNQSRFRLGNFCLNHLFTITSEIHKLFDNDFKVKEIFLDISKLFDKVWHEGVLLKLNRNGISGNHLKLPHNFLRYWKLRVFLNGLYSPSDNFNAEVR